MKRLFALIGIAVTTCSLAQQPRLYVTFHGSKRSLPAQQQCVSDPQRINTIYAYDLIEQQCMPVLTMTGLHELRGMTIIDNKLYVVNGNQHDSKILRFEPNTNGTWRCEKTVATSQDLNPLIHPYAITGMKPNQLFISNQNSNTVIAITDKGKPVKWKLKGRAIDIAPQLHAIDKRRFHASTFVASAIKTDSTSKQETDEKSGLDAKVDKQGHTLYSVRGLEVTHDKLFVANEAGNTVNAYSIDESNESVIPGTLLFKIDKLHQPVQLLLGPKKRYLYIGEKRLEQVTQYDLNTGKQHALIKNPKQTTCTPNGPAANIHGLSGMAFDPSTATHTHLDFYVASRKTNMVLQYTVNPDNHTSTFVRCPLYNLPDQPEFLLFAP